MSTFVFWRIYVCVCVYLRKNRLLIFIKKNCFCNVRCTFERKITIDSNKWHSNSQPGQRVENERSCFWCQPDQARQKARHQDVQAYMGDCVPGECKSPHTHISLEWNNERMNLTEHTRRVVAVDTHPFCPVYCKRTRRPDSKRSSGIFPKASRSSSLAPTRRPPKTRAPPATKWTTTILSKISNLKSSPARRAAAALVVKTTSECLLLLLSYHCKKHNNFWQVQSSLMLKDRA